MSANQYILKPVTTVNAWQIPMQVELANTIDIYKWVHDKVGDDGVTISLDTGLVAVKADSQVQIANPGDWIVETIVSDLTSTFAVLNNTDFNSTYQAV